MRTVGNGNHQCRGSGISTVNSVLGTKSQKAKAKKAASARKGFGGKLSLKNVNKSLNK